MLSYAVKAKIRKAHIIDGQTPPPPDEIRVELDTKNLVDQFEWLERKQNLARTLLRLCRLPHVEVAYEDLLHDQAHFRPIWEFLSIEPDAYMPQSTLRKIISKGHRDVIDNYDRVKEVLVDSRFAGLLD
jgi:hypothetical protein